MEGQADEGLRLRCLPQEAKGKSPGIVLVHGGGGKAFDEWARMWQTVEARIRGSKVLAELPAECPITWFVTLKDERGAIVSTEHEEITPAKSQPGSE